ncbi:MAG: hypothetical protein ABIT37_05890 [Luteolibacter sp.]
MNGFPSPRDDAKLKKRAYEDRAFADEMWRFQHPEDGGSKVTYEAILVHLRHNYQIESSVGALSDFYPWLDSMRRFQAAASAADAAKRRRLELEPDIALTELEEFGQFVFTNETIQNRDTLNFVRLKKLRAVEAKLSQDERKLVMLEAKAKQLDAAKEVMGSTLSTEEQNKRIRAILK